MANEIARGGAGNIWTRVESSLGTSAASWQGVRVDGYPAVPASTMKLIPPADVGGHRNPMSADKPVACDMYQADAFTITSRFHRASTDGNTPIMATFFEAAGWQHSQGPTAQAASTGAPTTTSIPVDDATGIVAGEACLVELAGVWYPTLAAAVAANTITPSIALPSAQDGSTDLVELMHTYTPTTATGYQVPTDKTLQFRFNTLGYYNNAVGDLAFTATGCALSSVGSIEIGPVGSVPSIDFAFHAGDIIASENDIAADSFQDSSPFVVINSDAQFAIAATNSGSGIGTLVTKHFQKLVFNTGLTVVPIIGQGGGGLNGVQAYLLVQGRPTVEIDCLFNGDTAMSRMFLDELHDANASKYVHFIQPTRNPDNPAMGIWMPNCHLLGGSEPTVDVTGDMIHITATLVGDLANWGGSSTDIDDVPAAPIVIATSGECA